MLIDRWLRWHGWTMQWRTHRGRRRVACRVIAVGMNQRGFDSPNAEGDGRGGVCREEGTAGRQSWQGSVAERGRGWGEKSGPSTDGTRPDNVVAVCRHSIGVRWRRGALEGVRGERTHTLARPMRWAERVGRVDPPLPTTPPPFPCLPVPPLRRPAGVPPPPSLAGKGERAGGFEPPGGRPAFARGRDGCSGPQSPHKRLRNVRA